MNFRYKLMQFMIGRYGIDELFRGLFVAAALLSVINLFASNIILQLVVYLIVVFAFYRVLSRNFEARRKENSFYKDKINFLKRKKEFYNQVKADKCHIYKKCPSCKAILRLPRRIGVHKTVCPKCGKGFTVKVRK